MTNEENWSKAMLLAQTGDSVTYKRLLSEVSEYVRSISSKKIRDPAHLDDLVQDVLLAIHKARHTYESGRPFMPWLHGIIRFKSIDALRKIYKDKIFEEWDSELHQIIDETFPPFETNEGVGEALESALQKLPSQQG